MLRHSWQIYRRALAYLSLGAIVLSAPSVLFAQLQTRSQLSARRFTLILRVVRPQWRDTFAIPTPIHPNVLTGSRFIVSHANSDAEFLKELRVNNEYFTFDGVAHKQILNLQADRGWQAAADFTRQRLWLAVVDKNRELLRNHLPDAKVMHSQQGAVAKPGVSQTGLEPPSAYKFNLTEMARQDLLQKGMLLVSYRITQSYAGPSGPVEYHDNDLVQFMNNGETFCLGTVLPVTNTKESALIPTAAGEVLQPTDLVFATVTEQK